MGMSAECSLGEHGRCIISVKQKRVWILVEPSSGQEKTIYQDFFQIQEKLENKGLPIKTAMMWPEIFECAEDKCGFHSTLKRLLNHQNAPKWVTEKNQKKLVAAVMYVPENHGRFLCDYLKNKEMVREKEMTKETVEGYIKY